MIDEEVLIRLKRVEENQQTIKQALWGPPGYPNGLMGQIKDIKNVCETSRKEAHEESGDLRRALRNASFTVIGSVLILVAAQYFIT